MHGWQLACESHVSDPRRGRLAVERFTRIARRMLTFGCYRFEADESPPWMCPIQAAP
jgi:hypothetical protein